VRTSETKPEPEPMGRGGAVGQGRNLQRRNASRIIGTQVRADRSMTIVERDLALPGDQSSRRIVIPIEDLHSAHEDVYIGERLRKSTATSVVLLDANTLACCHFNGCRMFLIRFDLERGTYTLLDSIDTVYKGTRCETDLMTGDGTGGLVTTNFFQLTCSLYQRSGDSIKFVRDIAYNAGDRVHGVKFYGPNIIAVTSRYGAGGVHFFDSNTLERRFFIAARGISVQDVCFPNPSRAIMISTLGSPQLFTPRPIYSSVIHVVDFDFKGRKGAVVKQKTFEAAHFDNIVLHGNRVFITDQYNNVVLALDSETLESVDAFDGYDFPHGLDINFGLLAVTNYGANTVEIRPLAGAS
jgi:hypothetical protein